MKVLILNGGSSSLKFSVFSGGEEEIIGGQVNRIGEKNSQLVVEYNGKKEKSTLSIASHKEALKNIILTLTEYDIVGEGKNIDAIGQRVVHGGAYFSEAVLITDDVKTKIDECSEIAPLHNPINLECIIGAEEVFAGVPQVAVFDTAFHQTIPASNYLYAIPKQYSEKYKIRKYGFHGISHQFISERVDELVGEKCEKIITCHIGNGASISAIKHGKCINTSMGFTPVDGLVMGTRSGDIDPGVVLYLQEKENLSVAEMGNMLNRESGMLGLTGEFSDLKDIEDGILEDNNDDFLLAMDVSISRIVRFIGGYIADLGGVDAIVFTAGALENSSYMRARIAEKLAFCGVDFDASQNDFRGKERLISIPDSQVKLYVIPTNEELMIKNEVEKLVK